MSSNNNKQFAFNQLIWIVISIGISLAISRLLPFPISIVADSGRIHTARLLYEKENDGKNGDERWTNRNVWFNISSAR